MIALCARGKRDCRFSKRVQLIVDERETRPVLNSVRTMQKCGWQSNCVEGSCCSPLPPFAAPAVAASACRRSIARFRRQKRATFRHPISRSSRNSEERNYVLFGTGICSPDRSKMEGRRRKSCSAEAECKQGKSVGGNNTARLSQREEKVAIWASISPSSCVTLKVRLLSTSRSSAVGQ